MMKFVAVILVLYLGRVQVQAQCPGTYNTTAVMEMFSESADECPRNDTCMEFHAEVNMMVFNTDSVVFYCELMGVVTETVHSVGGSGLVSRVIGPCEHFSFTLRGNAVYYNKFQINACADSDDCNYEACRHCASECYPYCDDSGRYVLDYDSVTLGYWENGNDIYSGIKGSYDSWNAINGKLAYELRPNGIAAGSLISIINGCFQATCNLDNSLIDFNGFTYEVPENNIWSQYEVPCLENLERISIRCLPGPAATNQDPNDYHISIAVMELEVCIGTP